jgi:hypothetical protein
MDDILKFCQFLSKKKNTHTVFNPYRDAYLTANLESYLRAIKKNKGTIVLMVGEAPGFKGCKHTGIPFSSSRLLSESKHPLIGSFKDKLEFRHLECEMTAKIIWDYLDQVSILPLLWNAFPFHPHISRKYKTNRAPSRTEVKEGVLYLQQLGAIFNPVRVVGVGRAGCQCAELAFPDKHISYVRHPSRGGKSAFIEGMNQFLDSLI